MSDLDSDDEDDDIQSQESDFFLSDEESPVASLRPPDSSSGHLNTGMDTEDSSVVEMSDSGTGTVITESHTGTNWYI